MPEHRTTWRVFAFRPGPRDEILRGPVSRPAALASATGKPFLHPYLVLLHTLKAIGRTFVSEPWRE